MGQHTNQIIPYWIVAPGPIDVRKHGAISGDGQDDTAAFTAALAEAATKGTYVVAAGHYNLGTFDWGNSVSHYQHRIEATGSWTLSAKVTLPSFCSIIGKTGSNDIAFGADSAFAIAPPTNGDPGIEITGGSTHRLENIKMQCTDGPGIHINGRNAICAYVWLVNCNVRSINDEVPILIERCFWLWMLGGSYANGGTADSSIWFNDDGTFPAGGGYGYNGIVQIRDLVIHTKGIKITNANGSLSGNIQVDNVVYESCLTDFFTIDSVFDLHITRSQMADSISGYYLNSPNGNCSNIKILTADSYYGSSTINPASKKIRGLVRDEFGSASALLNTSINPPWTPEFETFVAGRRNVRLDQNYTLGGFSISPGKAMNYVQDPAGWIPFNTIATVAGGKLGPDGKLNAGLVTPGATFDEVLFGAQQLPESIAIGDWFIAGVWVRNSASTGLITGPPRIWFWGGPGADFKFNNGEDDNSVYATDQTVNHNNTAWRYVTCAGKVTHVGAGIPEIYFSSSINANTVCNPTLYAYPSVVHIPAGTFSDREVMDFCRSIRNLPPGAKLGDLAILDHQSVRLGGGARLVSASAQPTTGTYEVGERVLNNGPANGEAESWSCTVAGTQGTLAGVTADTTSGTPTVTVSSAANLQLNQYITIAGVTGIKKIVRISGTTITIDSNASATVDDGAVAFSPATFVAGPPIGASFAKSISFVVTGTAVDAATGDNQVYVHIPPALNGYTINYVHAAVATAGTTGTTDVQIARIRSGTPVDVLSTKLTIDSAETGSDTAAAPAVINASNDDLATNDRLRIDVDAVSTTPPTGLVVTVEAVR